MNKKNRRRHLESLRVEERTMIFYEAPHKLAATLTDLAEVFGRERPVSLCRELSKLHEEIRRTTLGEAADHYAQNPPKGEFVLSYGARSRRRSRRSARRTAWSGCACSGRKDSPCGTR